MSDAPLRSRIRALLAQLAAGAPFGDADDLFTAGIIRSLHLMELLTAVEDTFGIEITERELAGGELRSVDRLVALVARRTELAS